LIFWHAGSAELHVVTKPHDVQSGDPGLDLHALVARGAVVVLPSARKTVEPGNWFVENARAHGKFEVSFVDLKEVNLPPMDEPEHPRFQKYTHDHTKAWSATVAAADAFVFVTPEYNFSTAPALQNALDYVYKEWNYKPVGFVSYGGISGGLRSVQMTKQMVTTLKMVPLVPGGKLMQL
jgi:NAD(P)H-dependent FMN reductase